MKFKTYAGWDYSSVIAVSKLDGNPAVEGLDYQLYKDGNNWYDAETGVILSEGIILYRIPPLYSEPVEPNKKWTATIRDDRLISNKPIEGEKNG